MHDLARYHSIIPAPPSALKWILGSFRGQIARMPGGPNHPGEQSDALLRAIAHGAARAVVACPKGYPDEFSGWAVGMGGALLFAYVRSGLRKHGIGIELMGAVTPVDATAIRCAYWTNDAEALACHGLPITYDIMAYRALLGYVTGRNHRPLATVAKGQDGTQGNVLHQEQQGRGPGDLRCDEAGGRARAAL